MDAGSTPSSDHTRDYQSGALSFEIFSNGQKLISNCGYYKKNNLQLNQLSKSSAAQSTLIIDDNSSCNFLFSKCQNDWKSYFFSVFISFYFPINCWRFSGFGMPIIWTHGVPNIKITLADDIWVLMIDMTGIGDLSSQSTATYINRGKL